MGWHIMKDDDLWFYHRGEWYLPRAQLPLWFDAGVWP